MMLAAIVVPSAPPTVRAIVFMPVAMPVCVRRDGLDDQVGHRGEGEADADAEDGGRRGRPPRATSARRPAARMPAAEKPAPRIRGTREPTRPAMRPAIGLEISMSTVVGSRKSPAPGDARSEAVAGARRQLDELRDQDERVVHPEADQQRGEIDRPDPAHDHHLHVHERLARARLGAHPGGQQHEPDREQADHPGREPAPGRRLAEAQQDGDEPARQQRRSQPVDAARAAHGGLGHEQPGRDEREHARRRAGSRTGSGSRGAARSGRRRRCRSRRRRRTSPRSARCRWRRAPSGNSSRTMPMPSGKTAPPMPWMPRPTSIGPIDVESAEITVPSASATSTITSTRSLPNMSPSRPAMGVATEAVSR